MNLNDAIAALQEFLEGNRFDDLCNSSPTDDGIEISEGFYQEIREDPEACELIEAAREAGATIYLEDDGFRWELEE